MQIAHVYDVCRSIKRAFFAKQPVAGKFGQDMKIARGFLQDLLYSPSHYLHELRLSVDWSLNVIKNRGYTQARN